jgi:very-short-patch-repair endonuclease
MHSSTLVVIAVFALAALAALTRRLSTTRFPSPYRSRPLMSPPELDAYQRLRQALPDSVICPQVQLCRFITADHLKDRRWHNRIAQLSADFAICKADGTVVAVIEVDDKTHERPAQRARDRKKDDACQSAGVPVIRWKATQLPTAQAIQAQVRDVIARLSPARGTGDEPPTPPPTVKVSKRKKQNIAACISRGFIDCTLSATLIVRDV